MSVVEASNDSVVGTPSGPVRGLVADDVAVWRGIPYALRPDGERYCRAPAPVPPWPDAFDARTPGPAPPQPGRPEPADRASSGPGSYLTVNVWAPARPTQRCPVLVWLCVGGNIVGSNDWPLYDGSRLVRHGVVLVTVNARLGPEGFTPLDDAPDNRAAMDWLAALGWVNRHIAAFGGDPGAVTLAGQSAGAGAVAALLTSPRAAGLFARAIIMSATTPSLDRDAARRDSRHLLATLGIPASRSALAKVPEAERARATAAAYGPGWRVADPVQRVRNMLVGPPFRLVEDAALRIEDVLAASRRGAGASTPVLAGHTATEFTAQFGTLEVADVALDAALEAIGLPAPAGRRAYQQRYPHHSPGALLGQAFTDAVFRLSSDRFATARRAACGTTYVYEFGPDRMGRPAPHGCDVPLVFGSATASVENALHEAVVRFVTTGEPGWPAYDERRTVARLAAAEAEPMPHALSWERSVWDRPLPFLAEPAQ